MYSLITIAIIVFIITTFKAIKSIKIIEIEKRWDFEDWLSINIIFDFFGIVCIFILSVFISFIYPSENIYYSFNINSLSDNLTINGNTSGNIFCIRGSVNEELRYFFLKDTPLGEKIDSIPSDISYIRYDNIVDPYVEVHQTIKDYPEWMKKVFLLEGKFSGDTINYYVIVVPEGTISTNGIYNIDLK